MFNLICSRYRSSIFFYLMCKIFCSVLILLKPPKKIICDFVFVGTPHALGKKRMNYGSLLLSYFVIIIHRYY